MFGRISAHVLGWGSMAFGVWALADREGFAEFMGVEPSWSPYLGVRDLVIGAALVARPAPAVFLARATADTFDATTARHANVSLGAAGFALWALTAAAASRDCRPR